MQGFEHTADEGSMLAVLFYADYFRAAAREEFERNAARAGKKIEGTGLLKIQISPYYVEQVFFCKVGGGTGLEASGHFKMAAFVFSGNDTHVSGLMIVGEHVSQHVVRHFRVAGGCMTVEFNTGVELKYVLGIFFQFGRNVRALWRRAGHVKTVGLEVNLHVSGQCQAEIDGVGGGMYGIGVAEQEFPLGKYIQVGYVVVSIDKQAPGSLFLSFAGKVGYDGSLG